MLKKSLAVSKKKLDSILIRVTLLMIRLSGSLLTSGMIIDRVIMLKEHLANQGVI